MRFDFVGAMPPGLPYYEPSHCLNVQFYLEHHRLPVLDDPGVTYEARRNMASYAAEQIVGIFRGGRPPRLINPEVWPTYVKRFEKVMGTRAQPEVVDVD